MPPETGAPGADQNGTSQLGLGVPSPPETGAPGADQNGTRRLGLGAPASDGSTRRLPEREAPTWLGSARRNTEESK